jgi:polyhydroxyalkanoate synthesis repressor PhaR
MKDERIIKKYPNRRLYDTEVSRYITLADVRDLVMSCTSFKVVDTANDNDITRSILLQIMLEEESGGEPLFTATMLSQIIRFYGGTVQGMFARYLESSLDLFSKQHKELVRSWGETPFDAVSRMTQRNVELWGEIQSEFMRAAGFDLGADRTTSRDPTKPAPRDTAVTGHDEPEPRPE